MNGQYGAGDTVLGGWKLIRPIGEGSYGRVFEASREDDFGVYTAAIKIITLPHNEDEIRSIRIKMLNDESVTTYFRSVVEKVVSEVKIMSKLKGNTNIVGYEDHRIVRHDDGIGWDIIIRMELLTPLIDKSGVNKKLTQKDIAQLGIDICKALELCQRYNIIHRDIKPENIFVSESDDFKLGDFGVARTVDKTAYATKAGTDSLMAPEVVRGEAYNSSVDIYTLGLVMYRLLNDGRSVFLPMYPADIKFDDDQTAEEKRLTGATMPEPRNADVRLAEIVLKACAHSPQDRYSSPMQMRQDLENTLDSCDDSSIIWPPQSPAGCGDRSSENTGDFDENSARSDLTRPIFLAPPSAPPLAPSFISPSDPPSEPSPEPSFVPQPDPEPNSPRASARSPKITIMAAASALIVVAAAAMLLVNHWPASEPPQAPPSATTDTKTLLPDEGANWSEWMDEMPSYINNDEYIIDTKTQYRSTTLLRSDKPDLDKTGYTLLNVLYGEWSQWSEWQKDPVEKSDTYEVKTETRASRCTPMVPHPDQIPGVFTPTYIVCVRCGRANTCKNIRWTEYSYRHREITYLFYRDGDWSEFSDAPINPSDSVAVNTKTLHRFVQKNADAIGTASMDNFQTQISSYSGPQCFADVDDSKWYGADNTGYVCLAAQLGAIAPDGYMVFRPDESLTIAEAIKAAVVLNRIYLGSPGALVETSVWYQVYVDYAIENAMIKDSDFSDYTAAASRQEAAYILNSALPASEMLGVNIVSSVTDMNMTSKYYMSVYQLAQAGIIAWPTPDYTFNPENPVTRAEAAAFAVRIAKPDVRLVND